MQKCTYNPHMSYSINFILFILLLSSIIYLLYIKNYSNSSDKYFESKLDSS